MECSAEEHESANASATAVKSLPGPIAGISTIRTESSSSLRDDLAGSIATGISHKDYLIRAICGLERDARFDMLNDDAFAGLLRTTLALYSAC